MNWRVITGWVALAAIMLFTAVVSLTGDPMVALRTVGYVGGGFGAAGVGLGLIAYFVEELPHS